MAFNSASTLSPNSLSLSFSTNRFGVWRNPPFEFAPPPLFPSGRCYTCFFPGRSVEQYDSEPTFSYVLRLAWEGDERSFLILAPRFFNLCRLHETYSFPIPPFSPP